MTTQTTETEILSWQGLARLGGAAAALLLVYSLAAMAVLMALGMPPAGAQEAFDLLREDRLIGLLRLDLLTIVAMPLYYLLFVGLCAALWKSNGPLAALAAALAFAGVTLLLATPSLSSLVYLSVQYAAAATDAQRTMYLTAGETVMAADTWHGVGAITGGIVIQVAGVLISVAMLRGKVFGQAAAYVGILTHGLDLARMLIGLVLPEVGAVLMMVAGPLYLVWFPMIGWGLIRLGRGGVDAVKSG